MKKHTTENLALAGLLIALGTVLTFIKVFHLPYGGSINLCASLPVMVFAYRSGLKWGLGAGFTFSVLQLLFGLDDRYLCPKGRQRRHGSGLHCAGLPAGLYRAGLCRPAAGQA